MSAALVTLVALVTIAALAILWAYRRGVIFTYPLAPAPPVDEQRAEAERSRIAPVDPRD
jgi:hypothetical protein